MDLKNFSTFERFFCKLLRIEADTKIVLDQSQALVGGCNFKKMCIRDRTDRRALPDCNKIRRRE